MTDSLVASETVHSYKYFDVRSLFAAACMFFCLFLALVLWLGPLHKKTLSSGSVNSKVEDQPTHQGRQIRAFIIDLLESLISRLVISKVSIF